MTQVTERKESNVVSAEPATILQVIQNAATNPDVDIEKMERLMQMHERLVERQNEAAFNKAMTDAQTEIRRVAADKTNCQTHSDYATYAQLDKAVRPIYTKHGFALSFDTGEGAPELYVRVLCYVSHTQGHSRTYHADIPADGKGAKGGDVMTKTHAAGSAMSYGRRYLLALIFNIAIGDDDDDGNAASGRNIAEEILTYNEAVREHFWTIAEVKRFLTPTFGEQENQVNVSAAREAFKELTEDEQSLLWRAPTKGGVFTTQERSWLKTPPEGSL